MADQPMVQGSSPPDTVGDRPPTWQLVAAFAFGVVFVAVLLGTAILIPNPTGYQIFVFRIVLALAAAGIGAVVPGVIVVHVPPYVRAGGAIALFAIIFGFNPPALVTGFTPFAEAMRRAQIAIADKNFPTAVAFFERARQADPQSWMPYHGLGQVEYQRGNLTVALEYYTKAFELGGKSDGSLAYAIALMEEGLGQEDAAEKNLGVALGLLPATSPIANEVLFDQGLVNLAVWLRVDAPRPTERSRKAELAFRNFLERRAFPSHWALYHLACLNASRADDAALAAAQAAAMRKQAHDQLERAVDQIAQYKSVKAQAQREMMRRLLTDTGKWTRGPGEPLACPTLIQSWTRDRGAIDALAAKLS